MKIEVLPRNAGTSLEKLPELPQKSPRAKAKHFARKLKKPRLYKSIEQPVRLYVSTMDVVDVTDPACRKWLRWKAKRRELQEEMAMGDAPE